MTENIETVENTPTPAEKLAARQAKPTGRPASKNSAKAAKRPQDHKKPAPKPDKDGYVYVDYRGVRVAVRADLDPAEDFELMDRIGALEDGRTSGLGNLLRYMVRATDMDKLQDACRGEDGRVSPTLMVEFVEPALEAAERKN